MKKTVRTAVLTALMAIVLSLLCSCFGGGEPTKETVNILKDGVTEYFITYDTSGEAYGKKMFAAFATEYDYTEIERYYFNEDFNEKEIVIGDTDRPLSKELKAAAEALKTGENDYVWAYGYKDGTLAFYANNETAYELGWQGFLDAIFKKDGIYFEGELYFKAVKTYEQYQQDLADKANADEQALIDKFKAEIARIEHADYGTMPTFSKPFGNPSVTPTVGDHPRVWVNSERLEEIKPYLEHSQNSLNYVKIQQNATRALNSLGQLPSTGGANFDGEYLGNMESLAFMYLLTGKQSYGYAAIAHAFNFIDRVKFDTSNIYHGQQIPAGTSLAILAEVYDWCHDLFTDSQKTLFVTGAINNCGVLMEFGFPPPSTVSGIAGHTTGDTILRNCLAFAIATYDEFPEIYDNIVPLLEAKFVGAPNWYYQSGVNPQGGYGQGKTVDHIWSELLIKAATGKSLYSVSFESVLMHNLYKYRPDMQSIRVGDETQGSYAKYTTSLYKSSAFYAQAMYGNQIAKAWQSYFGFSECNWDGWCTCTPVFYLIYNDPTIEYTQADRFNMELVEYSVAPLSSLIVRSAWNDANAWLTYTNMEEAYASNHDHKDVGTFQIYYKGILAPDSAQYQLGLETGGTQNFGSNYDLKYVKQTISKNGLLIYNPAMKSSPLADQNWGYSGGQTTKTSLSWAEETFESWLSKSTSNEAVVLGKSHAYDANGNVVYAYISGDITNAYDPETVELVMRSTMTLATNDPEHPMAMIVYDRIKSDQASYKKTFVLHTMDEPTFNDGAVVDAPLGEDAEFTYVDGAHSFYYTNLKGAHGSGGTVSSKYNGKLTAQTLLPEDPVYRYIGGDGKRFWVNGENVGDESYLPDTPHAEVGWGRVEISPSTSQVEDSFLNVMYVGDALDEYGDPTSNELIKATLIKADTHEGAMIFDNVVMFSKSNTLIDTAFDFTASGSGVVTYYVSGLANGTWSVSADGEPLDDCVVEPGTGIISFKAEAGKKIEISPKALTYVITYEANKGTINTEDYTSVYTVGSTVTLPANESVTREGYVFGGWYADKACTVAADPAIISATAEDVILYAKWNVIAGIKSNILYVVDGVTVHTQPHVSGTASYINFTPDPKEKYTFAGWFLDESFSTPANIIAEDITTDTKVFAKYMFSAMLYDDNGASESAGIHKLIYTAATNAGITVTKQNGYMEYSADSVLGAKADVNFDTDTSAGRLDAMHYLSDKAIGTSFEDRFVGNGGGLRRFVLKLTVEVGIVDGKAVLPILFNMKGTIFHIPSAPASDGEYYAYLGDGTSEDMRIAKLKKDELTTVTVYLDYSQENWTASNYRNGTKIYCYAMNLDEQAPKLVSVSRTTYSLGGTCFAGFSMGAAAGDASSHPAAIKIGKVNIDVAYSNTVVDEAGKLIMVYDAFEETALPETYGNEFKFDGWYADPDYTQPITSIPQGSTGVVKVYAKYKD